MQSTRLPQASFSLSAASPADLPESRAEVAFVGRSNAGKSSALNALARHNRLAFVSKTPGRTQLINFFAVGQDTFLVDLPGYGYAKVPLDVRKKWEDFLSGYLQFRTNLMGLVLIMDVRHPLTPLDWRMLDWFAPTGRPVHILLTKADKLSRGAGLKALNDVRRMLESRPGVSVQLFSSLSKLGVEEAETVIAAWLG